MAGVGVITEDEEGGGMEVGKDGVGMEPAAAYEGVGAVGGRVEGVVDG